MAKQDKKERIIEAGIELFSRKGYHKATVSEIAREADVAKGTLYWYFDSKKDLFQSIILFGVRKLRDDIKDNVVAKDDVIAKLEVSVEMILNFFKNSKQLAKMQQEGTIALNQEFKEQIMELRREKLGYVSQIIEGGKEEGLFKEGTDSNEVAQLLFGMISTYHPILYGESFSAADKAELIIKTLTNGIKA